MHIQIDNFVREMTPEEEEQYIIDHTHEDDANESDYVDALNTLGVDTNEEE